MTLYFLLLYCSKSSVARKNKMERNQGPLLNPSIPFHYHYGMSYRELSLVPCYYFHCHLCHLLVSLAFCHGTFHFALLHLHLQGSLLHYYLGLPPLYASADWLKSIAVPIIVNVARTAIIVNTSRGFITQSDNQKEQNVQR